MISCEEAAIICNKTQYKEASFLEKMKLELHILFCRACAGFSRKNQKLTVLCEKAQLRSLSEEDKLRMKNELKKHI